MGTKQESVHRDDGELSSINQQISSIHSQQRGISGEIIEVLPCHNRRPRNLVLDIPSPAMECASEECMRINVVPTPNSTPKRVNFSPIPSPSAPKLNRSSSTSLCRERSTMKTLLPKLSFKFRNTSSDIEKAAMIALGSPSSVRRERPRMHRTFSLTKIFTPRMNRTSSVPSTLISHSIPESMHGNKGRARVPIHCSSSLPVMNKDGSVLKEDFFWRNNSYSTNNTTSSENKCYFRFKYNN